MTLSATITAVLIAIVATVAVTVYVMSNRIKAHIKTVANERDEARDVAIRRLTGLASDYLGALEDYNRLVVRKLKVHQGADLLRMAESGQGIREELAHFDEVFDETILTLYPDFVEKVNRLLRPDRQLQLGEDGHLSPELRILAFMRLGVDDSSRIARLMGLTINTIYTYRNKAKTRALDRDNFERDIQAIA